MDAVKEMFIDERNFRRHVLEEDPKQTTGNVAFVFSGKADGFDNVSQRCTSLRTILVKKSNHSILLPQFMTIKFIENKTH